MLQGLNIFNWCKPRKKKHSQEDLSEIFRAKYQHFKELLNSNAELSKIIAEIEDKLQGSEIFGMSFVRSQSARAVFHTFRMVKTLNELSKNKYPVLFSVLEDINTKIKEDLEARKGDHLVEWILPYSRVTREMVDWVGGKSANLGEVLNRAGLPIPEGFAITTRAYEHFLEVNDLRDEINKRKMEADPKDPESINNTSEEIQRLIISTPVPADLAQAILSAFDSMVERIRERTSALGPTRVSLRSSAIGEDSELSYAGQYLSVLNVPREKVIQTYSYIIASLFTPRAISYRLNMGIRDEDVAMSVACLEMIDSVSSGVVYSRHPFKLLNDNVIISAVWGLGPYAVDGVITPDSHTVSKDEDPTILEAKISHKSVQLVSNPDGGLVEVDVPLEKQQAPCISPEQIKLLASYAIRLEKHYGSPQDMEWAQDSQGNILVLQTRPLRLEYHKSTETHPDSIDSDRYPLLISGGAVACPGVGFGPAHHVRTEDDLSNFPDGAVLIAKHSSPKYVVVMQKAQAIVTESGSVTGHMASVAREFGVPTLLDAKNAMAAIQPGVIITVDAYSAKIYEGKAPEIVKLRSVRESKMKGTPVYDALRRAAELIVPLRLIDPRSPTFTPECCKSLHDIMRLVHEYSYAEMFKISDLVSNGGGYAVKLIAPIPLDLYLIDLGGGLDPSAQNRSKTTVEKVASAPFKALLKGMLHEDLRYLRPRPVELKGFFSVMSEQMLSNTHATERFGDRSYAIISDKYLNFSSRIGYHYSILDSYCGQTMSKNYITFSFKGGAADDVRRNRRARAIALILKELDFTVDVIADRVDARLQKYEHPIIEEKLDLLGRLLQFTRQMDMLMRNEESIPAIAGAFLSGDYHLDRLCLREENCENPK